MTFEENSCTLNSLKLSFTMTFVTISECLLQASTVIGFHLLIIRLFSLCVYVSV